MVHVKVSSSSNDHLGSDKDDEPEDGEWQAEVYFTNPNYQAKRTVFLLFINRECPHRKYREGKTDDSLVFGRSSGGVVKN